MRGGSCGIKYKIQSFSACCTLVHCTFYVMNNRDICRVSIESSKQATYPELFMNTAAPSLVHLSATNLFSIFRKHGYGFNRKNPLQTNVLHDHHIDS